MIVGHGEGTVGADDLGRVRIAVAPIDGGGEVAGQGIGVERREAGHGDCAGVHALDLADGRRGDGKGCRRDGPVECFGCRIAVGVEGGNGDAVGAGAYRVVGERSRNDAGVGVDGGAVGQIIGTEIHRVEIGAGVLRNQGHGFPGVARLVAGVHDCRVHQRSGRDHRPNERLRIAVGAVRGGDGYIIRALGIGGVVNGAGNGAGGWIDGQAGRQAGRTVNQSSRRWRPRRQSAVPFGPETFPETLRFCLFYFTNLRLGKSSCRAFLPFSVTFVDETERVRNLVIRTSSCRIP